MKRFERRRLLRDVVGVEVGVGRSLVVGAMVVVVVAAFALSLPDNDAVELMVVE